MPIHRTLDSHRVFGDDALSQGGQIFSPLFEPRGPRLALLGNDHTVGVFDPRAGRRLALLRLDNARFLLAWLDDARLLVDTSGGLVVVSLDGGPHRKISDERPLLEVRVEDSFASADGSVVVRYEEHAAAALSAKRRWVRVLDGQNGSDRSRFEIELAPIADAAELGELPKNAVLVVHGAVLSEDGTTLAAVASVQRIEQSELDGQPVQQIHPVAGLALAWDVRDGRLRAARHVPREAAYLGNDACYMRHARMAFSPDGLTFASAGWLFDARTCELRHERPLSSVQWESVDALAFVDGGRALCTVTREQVALFDVATGERRASRKLDERVFVLGAAASDDAGVVAVVNDRSLLVFDLAELVPMHVAVGHTSAVRAVAVSPAGELVVSSDTSALIGWNARTGERLYRRASPAWPLIAFAPDGGSFVAPMGSQRPHLLDARTGEILAAAADAHVTAISWSDAGRVVSMDYEEHDYPDGLGSIVHVYDGVEAQPVASARAPYLRCLPALSAQGRCALLHDDTFAYGWDLDAGSIRWRREIYVVCAAISPDGALCAAVVIGPANVVLLDMATGETVAELDIENDGTLSPAIAWSPALDRVAVGAGADVLVLELDRASLGAKRPRVHRTLLRAGHHPEASALSFSRDGLFLASGGTEGRVALFALGPERHVNAVPDAPEDGSHAPAPTVGARVKLVAGAFAGRTATVVSVDLEARTARVEVSIFGRAVATTVPLGELSPAE